MYFLNDYYPYRKLVEVYYRKRDNLNVINTVEEFFKSGRFCNESQVLWFESNYKKACKYSSYSFSNFDACLDYFNEHGLKNKDKQNEPVPIAARIQSGGRKVKIISQEAYDIKSEYHELSLKYKSARSSKTALYFFEQLWDRKEFTKNLTAYKRLCSLYYETQQYEKVIKVAKEYFNSDARKTKSSPAWFNKKIAEASKKLDKSPINESSDPIKTTNLSNDELLFKYADLYEKGLLTKYEFDRKKKELLFNND